MKKWQTSYVLLYLISKRKKPVAITLQWRYNERDGVSNHQRLHCLLNRLFMLRSKHQSSASLAFVRGIPPVTGGFPSQRASDAENVSIGWRHYEYVIVHIARLRYGSPHRTDAFNRSELTHFDYLFTHRQEDPHNDRHPTYHPPHDALRAAIKSRSVDRHTEVDIRMMFHLK